MKSRLDDVGLHHQVLVDEVGRVGVVGMNAADFGSGQVDLVGFFLGEEGLHCGLVRQVELGMGAGDDLSPTLSWPLHFKFAHNGRAHHATMTCDINFRIFFQGVAFRLVN